MQPSKPLNNPSLTMVSGYPLVEAKASVSLTLLDLIHELGNLDYKRKAFSPFPVHDPIDKTELIYSLPKQGHPTRDQVLNA